MWKRAVCHWDPNAEVAERDQQGRRFALTLLEDLQQSYTVRDEEVLDQLYTQLTVGHGIYKTTRRRRFTELDKFVVGDVLSRFAGVATLRIHDLAASSGISSLELFDALRAVRPLEFHFSDLYDRLRVVRVPESHWEVVFDSAGNALEYVGHGFALSAKEGESRRYPVNRLLKRLLDRSLLPRADRLLEAAGERPADDSRDGVREVILLHPDCIRALDEHTNFAFRRHDLFTPLEGPYHVVRAMNIFNTGYFTEEQIATGVRASARGLSEGGLLVVGRSIDEEDGRTRVTAFVRANDTLSLAWSFNGGAENESLIDGLSLVEQPET